ncbi:hypothetical protein AB0K18_09095 [Nonomuraea sp. NPDC049421]|uniref:hypothetical protein n=1 Tax=Nonomuraea sp. NPDC049421 TaxID=3155275 RepID=UPI00341BA668
MKALERPGRSLARLLTTAATLAAVTAMTLAPAASAAGRVAGPAGTSVCLRLLADYNAILLRHWGSDCSPRGTYHIHVWGGGRDMNYPTYTYSGGNRDFSYTWPVPSGTNICAELWYHKPGGGYSSYGLPCTTM